MINLITRSYREQVLQNCTYYRKSSHSFYLYLQAILSGPEMRGDIFGNKDQIS